ncbi:MAG TPA: T9SS C-terminal target domain-containing protein [Bacteroidia bacterium]
MSFNNTFAQKGCTDPLATNYDINAKENDGSCLYSKTNLPLRNVCALSDTLYESSGLIHFKGMFWSQNDGGNTPAIYAFDSISGRIMHITTINHASNIDWEEITQDSFHIYIGDFGNNAGNRKDLCIYKIKKSAINLNLFNDTVDAEKIRFEMADQSNFNLPSQGHDYDMEAMFYHQNKLHLFSKNWADNSSRHYTCPTDSGFYSLTPLETLSDFGLVTGASINNKGVIALIGYNKGDYKSFIWLIWDYNQMNLSSGNKRRFETGNAIAPGQNEAIAFKNNYLYLSSEKAISNAQLYSCNYQKYINDSFKSVSVNTPLKEIPYQVKIASDHLSIISQNPSLFSMKLFEINGKQVYYKKDEKSFMELDTSFLSEGSYILELEGKYRIKIILY